MLLWRRPVCLSRGALALRQSARRFAARVSARRRTRRRTRSRRSLLHTRLAQLAHHRGVVREAPATRRGGERAAADPGAAEEGDPADPRRAAGPGTRRDARHPNGARGPRARARARAPRWRPARVPGGRPARTPRRAFRVSSTRRRRGRLPRRPRRRAAEARRRPERRSRPGGCRSGTLETKPPPPPPPRPLFRRGSSLRPPRSRSSGTARASRPGRA